MENRVFIYLLTFLFTVLLTDHLRRQALRAGWVDTPDQRKRHAGAIPPVGGEAIFAGCLLSALAIGVPLADVLALFAIGGIVLLVGALDDWLCFSASSRLAAQLAAATAMALAADAALSEFQGVLSRGEALPLGWLGLPLTVLATVMVINAVNLIDGMDGLAAGLVLIALAGIAVLAGMDGSAAVMVLALILASGTAAFLVLNMHSPWRWRASVFLGDSGSTFLGFALAWLIVQACHAPGSAMSPAVGLWLLMVPLFDATYVALRRMAKGHSPFHGDRQHLHHLFLRAGLPVGHTLALILGLATAGAVAGVLGSTMLELGDIALTAGFCLMFLAYCAAMTGAWANHPRLRRLVRRRMQSRRIAPVVAREQTLVAMERLEKRQL